MNKNKSAINHLITEGLIWPAQMPTSQTPPKTEPTLIRRDCSTRKYDFDEINSFRRKAAPTEERKTFSFNYPPLDSLLEGGLSCGKLHEWLIPVESADKHLSFPPLIILLYLIRSSYLQNNEKHTGHISNIWIGRELWPTSFWLEKLKPDTDRSSDNSVAENIFLAPQSNRDLHAAITQGLSSSNSIVIFNYANPSFALTRKWHLAARRNGSTAFLIRPYKINSQMSPRNRAELKISIAPQLPASCAATRWLIEPLQNLKDASWLVSLLKSKGLIQPECFTLTWTRYENTFSFSLYSAHTGGLDSQEITKQKKRWKKVS
ncbi:MAG: hypothetical protein PHC51_11775 [bacterium]|nr:hypothetical protein [bacterium]